MRKSNNYFKFLEYVTYGKDHDSTIDKGNSVLECKSYASISDIEYRYNTTFGLENEWLTFKNILIDEDTLYVYYLEDENSTLVGVYVLDNFKTQKELKYAITKACTEFLYDILLEKIRIKRNNDIKGHSYVDSDSEKSMIDTIIADDNIAYQTAKVTKTKHSVLEVMQCMMCPADREGNRCGGKQWCKQTWERYNAIVNPEWHRVSLNTLANLDFDMLDEKRQLYLKLYRELKELIQDLHKCKSVRAYDKRLDKMYIRNNELVKENKISNDYINYVTRKISMCNVECGVWTSRVEDATGLHKSRRYNRHILKY